MPNYPVGFPLHAPLTMFNGLSLGDRQSPSSSLAKIFESELHRHHMHLTPTATAALRTFTVAFIASLHMADAYREDLNILCSYLFPDQDQMTLITIKQNPTMRQAGQYEIRPFIFQTNPNTIVRKRISDKMLDKIRGQLELDDMDELYEQLIKAPVGIIEVTRPTKRQFRFRNAHGQELISENANNPPFKVYAYLTKFRSTKKVFSRDYQIVRMIPADMPLVSRADFLPDKRTNQIRFVEKMFKHLRKTSHVFKISLHVDTFVRFMAGFTMGVKNKYKLVTNTRVSTRRPEIMFDITFLLVDTQTSSLDGPGSKTPPVVVSFEQQELIDVGPKRIVVPEEVQMLTQASHFFWQRVLFPNERAYNAVSDKYATNPLRFQLPDLLSKAGDSAHTKIKLLVFEAIKRALRYYGPNTVKQTLLGMLVDETQSDHSNIDLHYARYSNEECAEQVMTVVCKMGIYGYVINVLDSDKSGIEFKGSDVRLDADEMSRTGIKAYDVLNVEMQPFLKERSSRDVQADKRNWKWESNPFLDSLSPDGLFPGLIYQSTNELYSHHLSRNREMKLERFPEFSDRASLDKVFGTKSFMKEAVHKLFTGPSAHICPIQNDRQALALFQTTMVKFGDLSVVPFDKSVSVISKEVEETVDDVTNTRRVLIFHKFLFSTRSARKAMVPFRESLHQAFPQIGHLTTTMSAVQMDKNQGEPSVLFCQMP